MTQDSRPETPGGRRPNGDVACSGLRLRLLGGFQLIRDGTPVAVPNRAGRLLAYLSLTGPSARMPVACALWPDMRDAQALACLRSTLWRLGRLAPGVVVARDTGLAIPEDVDVDVRSLRVAVRMGAGASDDLVDSVRVEQLLDLVTAELLPGWRHEWVVIERDHLRQTGLHALDALARGLSRRGFHASALQVALSAVTAEPLRESAYREAAKVHLAEGNLVAARRLYEEWGRILARELELAPSREFAELVGLPVPNVPVPRVPTSSSSIAGPGPTSDG